MLLPDNERLQSALGSIDAENAEDPNVELQDGLPQPRELAYSRWLTTWVLRLKPDASELLRLAARAQHVCRWLKPRHSYPQTKEGYLRWREDLKRLHARKAGDILQAAGYNEEEITRVRDLILKKLFPKDEEARVLEDALCLVFLEKQFGLLAAKTSDEKMVNALRKAWKKMSPAAREIALTIPYSPKEKALLDAALASGSA
jgi:hypothetical protein